MNSKDTLKVYKSVIDLDFCGYYPSCAQYNNISPETVT